MENQNTPPSSVEQTTEGQANPPQVTPSNKIVDLLNNLPKKLMENKKVLIIIGVVFVIFIILIMLISLISRSLKSVVNKNVTTVSSPSPSPIEQVVDPNKISTVAGELSTFKDQLVNLKNQIDSLNIDQSRLSPPNINFKINFEVKK